MHDNPLLPILRNQYKLLEAAGLRPGQKVVEVGCGPGFFTIPAAKMVGEEGLIYAIDVNQFAIRRVEEKITEEGISNIKPLLTNASKTGLPDNNINLAFIFGLRYIAGGMGNVLADCRLPLLFRYQSIVIFSPSRIFVFALNPNSLFARLASVRSP